MRNAGTVIFTTIMLLGAAVLARSAAGTETSLSREQVRALISGNTVTGPINARPYEFSYAPQSRVYGTIGASTDDGSWHIDEDGRYCHEWSTFFDGVERCYRWYDRGNGRYRMVNVDAFRDRDLEVWSIRPGLN